MAKQTVADLKKAIKDCKDDPTCITNAENAFVSPAGGGTAGPQEGGKVFSDSAGGKVFITTGGKVFG
jgi:hypothetical protein